MSATSYLRPIVEAVCGRLRRSSVPIWPANTGCSTFLWQEGDMQMNGDLGRVVRQEIERAQRELARRGANTRQVSRVRYIQHPDGTTEHVFEDVKESFYYEEYE